jgi:serine/threonine-protein kinase
VAFNALTGLLPFASESAQETMIMRLTDRPKTMADVRPDVDWPPELQAVMDKVLQRDVNERYQKSAEFGRDMAKAVEKMPAAVAAAANTVVIGAPAGRVPPTRPAPKAGATAKIEVPGATPPAKKSAAMLIVAAVVVIAAIGGGVMFMKGGSNATVPPPKVAAPSGGADSSKSKAADPSSPAQPPNAGATVSGTSPRSTVVPLNKPLPPTTARSGDPQRGSPAGAGAPTESRGAIIAHWDSVLKADNPSQIDAARAVDAVGPLAEKLTGQERSSAYWVLLSAYSLLDDAKICSVAKEVRDHDTSTNHKQTAVYALKNPRCE